MKKCFALATVLILSAGTFAADAPKPPAKAKITKKSPTVVFVDLRRVLPETTLFKRVQANLQAAEEAAGAAVRPKLQELSEKRKIFAAQESKMSPEEKEQAGRGLQTLQQEASEVQMKFKADLQQKQEEANRLIQEAMDEVSTALGKEFGWDAVLQKSVDTSLWVSDAVDQTDLFLERLNARPLPNHPLAAQPPAPAAVAPPPSGTGAPAPAPPAAPAPSPGK